MERAISFDDFRATTQHYSIGDITEFISDIVSRYRLFPEYARYVHGLSGIYIFDYTTFQYRYIDADFARIAERPKDYILDRGLGPKEKIWYAPDQEIFNEKIITKNVEYFKTIPADLRDQYLITCNYRNRSGKGGLKNILQKSFVIRSTPEGIPLAVLGVVTDISDIRNDCRLFHTIRNTSPHPQNLIPDYSDIFYSSDGNKEFTARHREIIKYLADGYKEREIADKLRIAPKTVENHKRQMRMFTNTKNDNQLIAYAALHGYL